MNLEEFVERTNNKMVYKIDAFKRTGSWGDFMIRGNVTIRLFPNQYFSGVIKENGDGTEIIFSFAPDSEQYETFLKSDEYQMMHIVLLIHMMKG